MEWKKILLKFIGSLLLVGGSTEILRQTVNRFMVVFYQCTQYSVQSITKTEFVSGCPYNPSVDPVSLVLPVIVAAIGITLLLYKNKN